MKQSLQLPSAFRHSYQGRKQPDIWMLQELPPRRLNCICRKSEAMWDLTPQWHCNLNVFCTKRYRMLLLRICHRIALSAPYIFLSGFLNTPNNPHRKMLHKLHDEFYHPCKKLRNILIINSLYIGLHTWSLPTTIASSLCLPTISLGI